MDKPREKCGVVGVSTVEVSTDAAAIAYQGLFALQHRGVEAAGIVTNGDNGILHDKRGPGMVRDVFRADDLWVMAGNAANGHVRYSTSGSKYETGHEQPIANKHIGFSFSHNGTLPLYDQAIEYLDKRRYRTSQYNDSGIFGQTIGSKIHSGRGPVDAIREAAELVEGAYSCVVTYDDSVIAFRDPYGIRPLEIGEFAGGVMFASESCAFATAGAKHVRSVEPGEIVVARKGEIVDSSQIADSNYKLDMFELVYFARHDSRLYGETVNEVRRRFGEELARMHPLSSDNSVVVPVPDTSVPAAEGYAAALRLPHEQAIIKNRFVGRTFMAPSQDERRANLQQKHTVISERVGGRDIILIDDSIVRGNTLPRLVRTMREIGARSVSVLIASPPVRFPDYYGVDTPTQAELMAANMTVPEMQREIDADYLGFLSISALVRATNTPANRFNLAAFNGEYPVTIGAHALDIKAPVSTEYMD